MPHHQLKTCPGANFPSWTTPRRSTSPGRVRPLGDRRWAPCGCTRSSTSPPPKPPHPGLGRSVV